MKRISSRNTFVLKKVFPLFWFGSLIMFVVMVARSPVPNDQGRIPLFVPCVMAVVGFLVFRKLIWGLADEVHDGGDFLVVRRGGEEESVRLDNIMNVSMTTNVNPPRITLRLVQPGRFGDEIAFSPLSTFSFNPFRKNPIAEDLMVRVDAARRGSPRRTVDSARRVAPGPTDGDFQPTADIPS